MFACRHPLHLTVFFVLTLLLFGCMSDGNRLANQTRKQLYIDANLQFEISYAEEWVLTPEPMTLRPFGKETVTWRIDPEYSDSPLLKLSIVSLSAARNQYGYNGLENILHTLNSNLLIKTRELSNLPVGATRKLTAETANDAFEVWLYIGKKRHYMINGAASTPITKQQRQMFEQIARSFRTIDDDR